MELEQAALMMKEEHERIGSDGENKATSCENSDNDENTTSDDDSSDESDDVDSSHEDSSEDVISKLTDITSKKQSAPLHEKDSLKTFHQYGYPDILQGDEQPHTVSVKEDFDNEQDEESEKSISLDNTLALTDMVLNPCVKKKTHCKLIEEIQDSKEGESKSTGVDDISAAVQDMTLSNCEEEQRQDTDACYMPMLCGLQSSDNLGCQHISVICKKQTICSKVKCTAENQNTQNVDLLEQNVTESTALGCDDNVMGSNKSESSLNCDQESLESWLRSPPRQKIELFEDKLK